VPAGSSRQVPSEVLSQQQAGRPPSPADARPLLGSSLPPWLCIRLEVHLAVDIGVRARSALGLRFPRLVGPPRRSPRGHSTLGWIPFRVSHLLLTVRPLGRIRRSLGFLAPPTASPSEPLRGPARPPQPSRFRSQAFSTSQRFTQARVPRPCFVPQPFLGSSLQSFSSRRSRAPLEAAGSLAVIHRRIGSRWTAPFTARFPDSHVVGRSRLVPRAAMGCPFPRPHRARARIHRVPGPPRPRPLRAPVRRLHPPRSFVPSVNLRPLSGEPERSTRCSPDVSPS